MYSKEHQNYLKKIRRNRCFVMISQISIIVLFLVAWQVCADKGIINTFISSSPREVVKTIVGLYQSNDLWHHIWITVYETGLSFILASVFGILIATILWWNAFLARVLDPYLTIINSLPKVALGPIIIIWAGAGIQSIIIMALLISLIITIINVYQGFIETDPNKIRLLKSFHATKSQLFFKLILPNSFVTIVSALKINVSMTLIGIIMGEFLVSKEGIGYLIMYGSQVFNLNLVMSGIIILCIVATIMYYLVSYIEKKLVKN
ncbi:MAG: ABC transporter permease [Bacilli bacterium]|jgi:NitT/TauT family transport system permease protein|nr:ABC transporter permease [Bacilli bacterium]